VDRLSLLSIPRVAVLPAGAVNTFTIRFQVDDLMDTEENVHDDAPPQSLYMLAYSIALIATLIIGVVYW
jgi:hypothetical protein